jgi:drug/metabolite transporter (DMT)-like permease
MPGARLQAFLALALACLFWSGNWIAGRALRDDLDPIALNFWRWVIAVVVLAPFALPALVRQWPVIRRRAGTLLLLAFTGVAVFQSLVYLGLRSTTAVNGVLLNSSGPLFILLCSWVLDRERATLRQIAGMLLSFAGILVILSRGELDNVLRLRFGIGDAWLLLAMAVWGVYSVLLKRRPQELSGTGFLFVISVAGVLLLAPAYGVLAIQSPPRWPGTEAAAGVLYMGLVASVLAFICWNRGVAVLGANTAGFTLHLLPAFGTLLAILFLGESFHAFHAAGVAIILAGVLIATLKGGGAPQART